MTASLISIYEPVVFCPSASAGMGWDYLWNHPQTIKCIADLDRTLLCHILWLYDFSVIILCMKLKIDHGHTSLHANISRH